MSLISSIVLPVVTNIASGGLTDLARRYSWWASPALRYAARGLLSVVLAGLVLGGVLDLLLWASDQRVVTFDPPLGGVERVIALLVAPGAGLVLGLSFGPVVGVLRSFRIPETDRRSVTPRSSIAGAARMAVAAAVLIPAFLAITPSLITAAAVSAVEGASSGLEDDGGRGTFLDSGAFVAVIVLLLLLTYGMPALLLCSQWVRFRLVAWYYAGTGRLPWRLLRFLDDAHRRGVLRREGPVYQFRHAHLQDRLAGKPRSRPVRR